MYFYFVRSVTTILEKYGTQMETTRNARPSSLQNTEVNAYDYS
jgi:hypothetical protein